jgi:hypothetical protein
MAESFRDAGHLPNLRDGHPRDPRELPRQRRGVTPQMHGRYPDFDVLGEAPHWDEVTRGVVLDRVHRVPAIRFFTDREAATLGALCDIVMAQDDNPRIPVLAMIDDTLWHGRLEGFQYADLPDDGETWRMVARGLDEQAEARFGFESYALLSREQQDRICGDLADGTLAGGSFDQIPAGRAWLVVSHAIVAAFYSHPWSWNEIGFSGPAYPRGFARLGVGMSEAWEGREGYVRDPVDDEA